MKSGRYFKPPGRGFPATAEGRAAFASSNEQHLDTSPKSCFTISWQFCLDASSIRWSKDSMCVGPARALGSPWCLSNGTRADSQGCWGWTFGTHAPKDPRLGWPRKWFCFSWRFFFWNLQNQNQINLAQIDPRLKPMQTYPPYHGNTFLWEMGKAWRTKVLRNPLSLNNPWVSGLLAWHLISDSDTVKCLGQLQKI